jgi:hypothetical protein
MTSTGAVALSAAQLATLLDAASGALRFTPEGPNWIEELAPTRARCS